MHSLKSTGKSACILPHGILFRGNAEADIRRRSTSMLTYRVERKSQELKKQWGTMQKVLSSRSRMEQVVSDMIFDFSVKPRLPSARGNAMLAASSIYEACKYFSLFQKTPFKGKCALVTSYNPQAQDITREDAGANSETDKELSYNTYTKLLQDVAAQPGMSRTATYEEWAKALFIKEPAQRKLLIVVDRLDIIGFKVFASFYA